MTVGLRLRIILGLFWAVLISIATGAALESYQLYRVSNELLEHELRLLVSANEMLLAVEEPLTPEFSGTFEQSFAHAATAAVDSEADALEKIHSFYTSLGSNRDEDDLTRQELRQELQGLISRATLRSVKQVSAARSETRAAALGLGLLCAALLFFAAWPFRVLRTHLFDPLREMDRVGRAALSGESFRRVTLGSEGEFRRLGEALNALLDEQERREGELRGRLAEVRALVTAILHRWPRPACVTGIDGEILVSTLSPAEEADLRNLTPRIRSAARVLLSRGFASAQDLNTHINLPGRGVVHLQSLAVGEKRIVGWLATFASNRVGTPAATRSEQSS